MSSAPSDPAGTPEKRQGNSGVSRFPHAGHVTAMNSPRSTSSAASGRAATSITVGRSASNVFSQKHAMRRLVVFAMVYRPILKRCR